MTAVELFREFEAAQRQVRGEFAYFYLMFVVPEIGCAQNINSLFDGGMIMGLLNAAVEKKYQPLAVIGIPTLNAIRSGVAPYVRRFVQDDWATGYIDSSIANCIWMMENNPPVVRSSGGGSKC
jgi:hypothetical protein